MESRVEKLKPSRAKFTIKASQHDLEHAAEHAFDHLTGKAVVKGFRPGKAPRPLLVQSVGKARLLSELVDHALPELLMKVADEHKLTVIEPPAYAIEKLCELHEDGNLKEGTVLEFTAEADFAPEVKVGDYSKIKIKPTKQEEVTDKTIEDILTELADRRAAFNPVDRAAKEGDRVEIDFAGKRNGIPEERLASKHYPVMLGSKVMIPGFEDQLVGKKAGEAFSFEITFPKDYHAQDLADQKVVFDITVHEVAEKKLPEFDDVFAQSFGQENIKALRQAIRDEREVAAAQEARQADEAATLEELLKLVDAEVPESLIERETDRQMDTLREQSQSYGLTFDHYLKHIKKTEEELRKEMRPTAEKAVKIGLGLGEVVKRENLNKEQNSGYAAIEKLVEISTQPSKAKK